MSENDRAAFIMSQAACMVVEAMGMQAQNEVNRESGCTRRYSKEDFDKLVEKYGMGHNSVLMYLQGEI